jgi:hypothetical protein
VSELSSDDDDDGDEDSVSEVMMGLLCCFEARKEKRKLLEMKCIYLSHSVVEQ